MLNALLKPEAKKPPKGAMRDAKMERGREWSMAGYATKLTPSICTQGNHGEGEQYTVHATHIVGILGEQIVPLTI